MAGSVTLMVVFGALLALGSPDRFGLVIAFISSQISASARLST